MAEDSVGEIRVEITPDRAVEFLQKLATNEDSVRDRFENDTAALLAEYGITVSPELLPANIVAPPTGMLLEALTHLERAAAPQVPFIPYTQAMPVPFGPVPFAPFSFAYSIVFLALHAASE
jgi:hypothetical protein